MKKNETSINPFSKQTTETVSWFTEKKIPAENDTYRIHLKLHKGTLEEAKQETANLTFLRFSGNPRKSTTPVFALK